MKKITLIAMAGIALLLGAMALPALADNPISVTTTYGDCGETTFTATNSSNISNAYLVVYADGETQAEIIPSSGDVSITVGPFYDSPTLLTPVTILWRVFGGGERDYDIPHWNGYGEPDFGTDINDYANEVGSFSWVIAGPDDPNPFTTWNEISVTPCPLTKDDCKNGGWQYLTRSDGTTFKNQGDCIQYVNTGK